MMTVARRTFQSSPYRDTLATWGEIVNLLTKINANDRNELESVAGIASSTIADKACESSPIIVTSEGPQTRIYCLYDDEAIDGSNVNEDVLGFDPLRGGWHISLPCDLDDLEWVQAALKKKSSRITARDRSERKNTITKSAQASEDFEIDLERLNS